MEQLTFAEAEFHHKKRKTRREKFLDKMENLIPWKRLQKKIAHYYPKPSNGRSPYPFNIMLRVHCMQLFYNLSGPAMADALYELESMRQFSGLSLSGPLPDETTILKFRHLLEQYRLGKEILKEINHYLEKEGLLLREGTIVDATIISASTSTKNQASQRELEMHQTKKGNEWHFGVKMHIGVDETFGVIHSMETILANIHDITQAEHLLDGKEGTFWGDAAYLGADKREEMASKDIDSNIAARPGKPKQMSEVELLLEKTKASVRAKVEHPFLRIEQQFGYSKVRYRGLEKNNNRLHILAAFSNLLTVRKMLPA